MLTNDSEFNLRLVREGVGLGLASDAYVRDDITTGDLIDVLAEYSTPFPGYFLRDPERRHVSLPLRALIQHVPDRAGIADRASRRDQGDRDLDLRSRGQRS